MTTTFVMCCCTAIVLIQMENMKQDIFKDMTEAGNVHQKNTKKIGCSSYLSKPEADDSHQKNQFSSKYWCLSERQKFLEFAARVVMLQEDVKLESSFEGIARKLTCYYVSYFSF